MSQTSQKLIAEYEPEAVCEWCGGVIAEPFEEDPKVCGLWCHLDREMTQDTLSLIEQERQEEDDLWLYGVPNKDPDFDYDEEW